MSAASEKASVGEERTSADAAATAAFASAAAPAPVPAPAAPVAKKGFFSRRKAQKAAATPDGDEEKKDGVVDVETPKVEEVAPISFFAMFRCVRLARIAGRLLILVFQVLHEI